MERSSYERAKELRNRIVIAREIDGTDEVIEDATERYQRFCDIAGPVLRPQRPQLERTDVAQADFDSRSWDVVT